jgi:serine/threonine protein kinase
VRAVKVMRMVTQVGGPAMNDEHEDEIRPIVSHKYRCVLRLDSGGMAEVFLAVSRGVAGFNKLFVLKRLRESLADDAQHRDMFMHEARLAARLNHPNVVQTYEVGEDDEGIFIAMEYLEGQPLSRIRRELVKQERDVSQAVLVRIVSEVLAGLHYAHELADYDGTPLRIVHRDVSPQNVFVTYDGQVKLVDFGIAKTHDSGTQAGIFKGKFAYTSPEQIRGEGIDRRADVFTAGILLWEMLTGQKLLDGNNPPVTFARLLNQAMPSVRSIVPQIDARLDAIVMRALERNPAARYQTAQAMRDALEEYLVASDHAVRHDQLAQLVGELFKAERTRVQNVIKEELAGLVQAASSSRIIAAKRLPLGDESVSVHASTPAMTRSAVTRSQPPEVIEDTSRKTLLRRGGFALGGVALAALIYAAARPRAAAPPPAPIEPAFSAPAPPPPAITASAPPAVVSAPPPEPVEDVHAAKAKWKPSAKKAPPVTSAAPTVAAPPPTPAPPPPAPAEPSSKEKRKFRVEL